MNEFQFNPKKVLDLTLNGGDIARILLIAEIQTDETVAQLIADIDDRDFRQGQEPITTKEAFLGMVEAMRTEIKGGRQPAISELEKRQAWAYWTAQKSDRLAKSFGWAQ